VEKITDENQERVGRSIVLYYNYVSTLHFRVLNYQPTRLQPQFTLPNQSVGLNHEAAIISAKICKAP
jgi:hypothetical protein